MKARVDMPYKGYDSYWFGYFFVPFVIMVVCAYVFVCVCVFITY